MDVFKDDVFWDINTARDPVSVLYAVEESERTDPMGDSGPYDDFEELGDGEEEKWPTSKQGSESEVDLEEEQIDVVKCIEDMVLSFLKQIEACGAVILDDAQLFRVLDIMHEGLVTGTPTTKRDIYYKDVALFGRQSVVDTLVDDLAATWGTQRCDLNVPSNIPAGEDIESFGVDEDIAWVLVVEKELTATKGKGYPDIATRHLVKSLGDALPKHVALAALVDCDPYGIDILSVYRYGSQSMRHENDTLATRRIKWLGLRISEVMEWDLDPSLLLPLTDYDENKIRSMLKRPHLPRRWRDELEATQARGRKAEIEVLCSLPRDQALRIGVGDSMNNPLLAYVEQKLHSLISRAS
ncbi:Spo11 [Coprinopsis cinerea okayama7|uniref:DNA topoisomerase (ATP-hydrolyzing) n=1 Tax=Coprinopsis cinerea (strain Okayama-7 / 130 / ATCC MYA-4618 / FGSC 9003) TaxID=240176 RepID=A8N7H7_COPC7|nr:Spo11 [Coprinopsis cinerea okayama7\|eukprot:XP_001830783.2 Spo11 [Coprinopsis cinerea okayama7\